jgi:hypothetical protein
MRSKRSPIERLEALVDALEDRIANATDREILADDDSPSTSVRSLRHLITAQLRARAPVVPGDSSSRMALLQSLLTAQRAVPPSVRMAFSDGKQPSEAEVEDLIRELIQLGLLDGRKP